MIEKTHPTTCGEIHYWTNSSCDSLQTSFSALIFLPGLTADHRLFEQQIAFFEQGYRVLVWDAPAHAASWPFDFSFTLKDKAIWLDEILQKEHIEAPVIVGQSMGGYVGQMYAQLFPDKLRGFISIDSAPLQRVYVTATVCWLKPWRPICPTK